VASGELRVAEARVDPRRISRGGSAASLSSAAAEGLLGERLAPSWLQRILAIDVARDARRAFRVRARRSRRPRGATARLRECAPDRCGGSHTAPEASIGSSTNSSMKRWRFDFKHS